MKRNNLIILSSIIIFLLIFLPMFSKKLRTHAFGFTTGMQEFLSSTGIRSNRTFHFFFAVSDIKKQNEELSKKITELQVDSSKISELEYENMLLKKELGFAEANKDLDMIPARIIGRDPISFLDYVIVDKGKDDGVSEKDAVVSNGALIGQVKEAFSKTSKITLITSKNSTILAMFQNSRAQGILRGGLSGLVLEDIAQDFDLKIGSNIITSGLEGEISQGILIGRAGLLKSSSADLFKAISVEPAVDLSKLEVVFIRK